MPLRAVGHLVAAHQGAVGVVHGAVLVLRIDVLRVGLFLRARRDLDRAERERRRDAGDQNDLLHPSSSFLLSRLRHECAGASLFSRVSLLESDSSRFARTPFPDFDSRASHSSSVARNSSRSAASSRSRASTPASFDAASARTSLPGEPPRSRARSRRASSSSVNPKDSARRTSSTRASASGGYSR